MLICLEFRLSCLSRSLLVRAQVCGLALSSLAWTWESGPFWRRGRLVGSSFSAVCEGLGLCDYCPVSFDVLGETHVFCQGEVPGNQASQAEVVEHFLFLTVSPQGSNNTEAKSSPAKGKSNSQTRLLASSKQTHRTVCGPRLCCGHEAMVLAQGPQTGFWRGGLTAFVLVQGTEC